MLTLSDLSSALELKLQQPVVALMRGQCIRGVKRKSIPHGGETQPHFKKKDEPFFNISLQFDTTLWGKNKDVATA